MAWRVTAMVGRCAVAVISSPPVGHGWVNRISFPIRLQAVPARFQPIVYRAEEFCLPHPATGTGGGTAMSIHRARLGGVIVVVGALSFAAGTLAQGRYVHINQAEAELRSALYQLRIARNVLGGHKRSAEGLINQA